ncbi:MAG: MarR family transcriptional regulator [Candidatus Aminicenantes bacterium]|nr:MarR family transcriptional regulator [Candidatus Aminicenantes bacterium]
MDHQNESLMELIVRLKAKCIDNEIKIMEESNLSPSELHGIEQLNPKEVVSSKHFSKKMHLSPSRVSRVVEKMVQNGFLIRHDDPIDRRRCKILLSEKGETVKRKIEMMRRKCERKVRRTLTKREIEHFTLSIKKTIKSL